MPATVPRRHRTPPDSYWPGARYSTTPSPETSFRPTAGSGDPIGWVDPIWPWACPSPGEREKPWEASPGAGRQRGVAGPRAAARHGRVADLAVACPAYPPRLVPGLVQER